MHLEWPERTHEWHPVDGRICSGTKQNTTSGSVLMSSSRVSVSHYGLRTTYHRPVDSV